MVRIVTVFLCAVLAACSQTGTSPAGKEQKAKRQQPLAAKTEPHVVTANARSKEQYAALTARCEAAVLREQQKSVNRARLGSALSMVGGFAGVGGEAAAIAGQAASIGGSLVSAGAESNARTAIEKECMP